MEETPTKQELISLVESMCEVQDRMLGAKRVWMASFKSSPGEYLEECLSLLRDYKVPISEYDGGTRLKQTLMNFYADMMEMYERG